MNTRIYAVASVALIGLMIAGAGVAILLGRMGAPDDQFAQCRTTAIAGGADVIGGPFTLISETGETVTEAEVITEASLLYFGYTFCPDVCPFDSSRNAEAVDMLEADGHIVQPVFISVDPQRDTPEVLAAFTENMHERMLGLTGSPEQVDAAADAYRVYYRSQDDGSDPYYLVDHSALSYLVLPGHGFVEFFRGAPSPLTPQGPTSQEVAERIACFLNAAETR